MTRDADTRLAGRLARAVRGRPMRAQAAALLLWLVTTSLAVLLCNRIVPGFYAEPPWAPLLFSVALAVTGLILQPLMVAGAVRLGWFGVGLLAVVGQSVVVATAAWAIPQVRIDTLWSAFLVAMLIGVVGTVTGWLSTAGTDEALVGRLVRSSRGRRTAVEDPDSPGVVFVQLDGVPYPVLQWAIAAGTVPTMTRWVRGGTHMLHEWTPKLPATTPASQMGILHGVIDGIPAFRWYDRSRDRVLVTNRPADARLVESALSTGRGLLADGGASISNIFSGDAPYSALTMSRRADSGDATRRAVAQFVSRPSGLTRALSRSVAELARDRFQSRRAVRRDVQPRCRRSWSTALLRCVTNGALRDVNTTLVAQHMLQGTKSVYVDYVDFDEIAHHAGMLRPESLEALEAVDGVLRQLELVASVAPRSYRFVVLSDHGQAQGATFADRYGEGLAELVARLAQATVAGSSQDIEGWARTDALVDDLAGGRGVGARTMRNASDAIRRHDRNRPERIEDPGTSDPPAATQEETFHVFGSGNLGLIYVRGEARQLTRQQLDERFAALIPGLAAHPGIGFVAVLDEVDGPVALGAAGRVRLADSSVVGTDPLLAFGQHAQEFLLRAVSSSEAPDIYVNSLLEPGTDEVAAFEELVGCHGGLGGWQDRAFVMVPSDVPYPADPVIGADAVHVVFTDILRHLGHRTGVSPAMTRHR
jgi:uncharacterized membrane protein YvlD (DUF360 family)